MSTETYIPLATSLHEEDKKMNKLYVGLWGKRKERLKVILDKSCRVPPLPSMDLDGQILPSIQVGATQGSEEPNPASVDVDVEMDTEPPTTPYRYIQLPDGLVLPTITREPPRTRLLVRSCYDEILERIIRDNSPAAVLGSSGIGEHIRIPIPPVSFG